VTAREPRLDNGPLVTTTAKVRPATRKKTVKRRARRKPNPFLAWRKRLDRTRPGLIEFTFEALAERYGHHEWLRRWDPTSELVMTILTQNSADVVITGEGRIDAQTAFGKTALGVARLAHASGVRCIAVGGGVDPEGIAVLRALDVAVVPVVERPQSVEEAIRAGTEPVRRCGERIALLISIGVG